VNTDNARSRALLPLARDMGMAVVDMG
jgi:hypothetical protein